MRNSQGTAVASASIVAWSPGSPPSEDDESPITNHKSRGLRMTLRQLRIFAAVARLGSFSRAAEELQISQPSVSIQGADLERGLGVDLFTQEGRRAHLNGARRVRDEYARPLPPLVDESEASGKGAN